LLACADAGRGDEPPKTEAKPPWQRLLQGNDAKQAATLQARIEELEKAGDYPAAITVAKQLLALREGVQGADHWEVGDARRQVEDLQQRAKFNEQQRADHQRAQTAIRQADALEGKGRYAQAQPLREQALTLVRQLFGAQHLDTAERLNELARNLNAQGKYAEAEDGFRTALALKRQLFGENHPETATAANNLAMNLFSQGKYAEAEEGFRKALALKRQLLGEENADTALIVMNLAGALYAQAKYAEAEDGFRKALALFRKLLGEEHPYTGACINNLAATLQDQGKYDEAEENYRKSLDLARKRLGEEHPVTATGYHNVAAILTAQGKYAEAERLQRKALALRRRLLGEEHPDTAQGYESLAFLLYHQGRYAEAETGFLEALAVSRKVLGDNHPQTAQIYNNLALNLSFQGRYAEAEAMFQKALALRLQIFGEKHPVIAQSYDNLGLSLQVQGKYKDAEAATRKALALFHQLLGDEHPDTTLGYHNLAASLYEQGKYAEAEENNRKALLLCRGLLGEEHPQTALNHDSLALTLRAQGKYAEAEEGLRKALAIRRQWLGEEHPDTAVSYTELAISLAAQQRDRDAEAVFEHAADAFIHARPRLAASGLERAAADLTSPFPLLAALLARHGKAALAWQRFEQGLGRGTWDDLEARLARSPEEQARLAELARRLEHVDLLLAKDAAVKQPSAEQVQQHKGRLTERRQLQEQLDTLTGELSHKHGLGETRAYALEQVQGALPANTALLGWVDFEAKGKAGEVVNERWAVLLRSKGPPTWVSLRGTGPSERWTDADTRLADQLGAALHDRPQGSPADWRSLARRLYQQRLQPLESHLAATTDQPAVRHLVVLPSELMDGVPLEVLTDRWTFTRVPSATVFAFLRGKPKPQTRGLLALADPVFDRPEPADKSAPLPPAGLLLTAVVPGSNASRAGLHAGDVLLRYKETVLKTAADLKLQAAGEDPKVRLPVLVWRAGEELTVEVAPGPLGVSMDREPAPEALAKRRRIEGELVASRGDGNWKTLPATRVEGAVLARLFQQAGQQATLLTDSDASEQRLSELAEDGTLGKVRYLHLATHGKVNWDFPLQSAIILARDRLPDPTKQLDAARPVFDGRLTAAEVLRDWNLDADLVTLSACETGLGRYARGEGYLGFAQALLLVGSRSVCLSLWQVDDAATALLMDRFYANLLGQRDGLKQPLGKAEALAEAKTWLRTLPRAEALKLAAKITGGVERGKGRPALPLTPAVPEADRDEPPYAHPFYWAAFVLVGDND
jgi:CHAT domain-containing protein/Tfp pilus assembly protein PilF